MKKILCLVLSLAMLLGCVSGLAESAQEEALFLKIKEGKTAQVFQAPGDQQAVDTLKAGQFCGLIEETASGGASWYYVFYLKSGKTGALGYIAADDAEKLSQDDVAALLADPGTADDLLDLISALYDSEAEKTSGSDSSKGDSSSRNNRRERILKGLQLLRNAAQKLLQSKAVERLRNRVGGGKVVDSVKQRIANLKEKMQNLRENEAFQGIVDIVKDRISDNLDKDREERILPKILDIVLGN